MTTRLGILIAAVAAGVALDASAQLVVRELKPQRMVASELSSLVIPSNVLVSVVDDPANLRIGDGVRAGGYRVGNMDTTGSIVATNELAIAPPDDPNDKRPTVRIRPGTDGEGGIAFYDSPNDRYQSLGLGDDGDWWELQSGDGRDGAFTGQRYPLWSAVAAYWRDAGYIGPSSSVLWLGGLFGDGIMSSNGTLVVRSNVVVGTIHVSTIHPTNDALLVVGSTVADNAYVDDIRFNQPEMHDSRVYVDESDAALYQFEYREDYTAKVTNWLATGSDVYTNALPEYVVDGEDNEYSVTEVGTDCFKGKMSGTRFIQIPGTVTNIRQGAYWGANAATNLTICGNALQTIEMYAFYNPVNIRNLYIPASVKTIAPGFVMYTGGLTNIVIAGGGVAISSSAFTEMTKSHTIRFLDTPPIATASAWGNSTGITVEASAKYGWTVYGTNYRGRPLRTSSAAIGLSADGYVSISAGVRDGEEPPPLFLGSELGVNVVSAGPARSLQLRSGLGTTLTIADEESFLDGSLEAESVLATTLRGAIENSFVAAPASSTASGTRGQIAWTNGYFYVCVSNDVWRRTALDAW